MFGSIKDYSVLTKYHSPINNVNEVIDLCNKILEEENITNLELNLSDKNFLSSMPFEQLDFYLFEHFFRNIAEIKWSEMTKEDLNELYINNSALYYLFKKIAKDNIALKLMYKYGWQLNSTHAIYIHLHSKLINSILNSIHINQSEMIDWHYIEQLKNIETSWINMLNDNLYSAISLLQTKEI